MGRLPTHFAGKEITFRIPYTIPGELLVPLDFVPVTKDFPEATFQHNSDKPFEMHRMIPRVTMIHTNNDVNPPQDLVIAPNGTANSDVASPGATGLERFVRLRILDTSKNENINKAGQLIEDLTLANTRAWDWEEPYTIVRSEGFQISVDIARFTPNPLIAVVPTCVDSENVTSCVSVDKLRIDITLEGFLIVIAPPSERR